MSLTLTVPQEYGYVVLAATFSALVGQWHSVQVGKYRKIAKVPYPNAYATESDVKEDKAKYLFNCAQRSHANFMEHQPGFLVSLLVAGLKYPTISAGLGLAWSVGRVIFALGYVSKDKTNGSGRRFGNFYWLAELALQFTAGWTGYQMLVG